MNLPFQFLVIFPSFNNSATLARALQPVLDQQWRTPSLCSLRKLASLAREIV